MQNNVFKHPCLQLVLHLIPCTFGANYGNSDNKEQHLRPSLRNQPTFGDATKWRLRNESKNSILMTHHYPDKGSASDWLNQISHAAQPIRSTTQIPVEHILNC